MVPVNRQLRDVLQRPVNENLGLLLDKYHAKCPTQEDQKQELAKVAELAGRSRELAGWLARRRAALDGLGARRWTRTTGGPLTLQLSRAGSFENAGICLHPVYGFVYLPGTGIKGMARAFAETVEQAPPDEVERVFGRQASKEEDGAAGAVVFHEAWPVRRPKLVVDVVNNHHRDYYGGDDDRNPPDDFENPNPVYFLAVPAGAEFEFALSPRQGASLGEDVLEQARRWVDGALTLLGAGAKTNAGYGRFKAEAMPAPGGGEARFTATLALETPAFLAGADQQAADCELRPATLRGLLRWWWRTLHSAHLSVSRLRKLEAAIWGDTEAGGAVALSLEGPTTPAGPLLFEPSGIAREHGLEMAYKPARPLIEYSSYGMWPLGERHARHYLPPGPEWRLTVSARARGELSAEQLLEQARLALWLLGRYGGVGSKARRGFGSLKLDVPSAPAGLEEARKRAADVRTRQARPGRPVSSSLDWMEERELRLRGNEPWFALDQLRGAYQSFTLAEKHKPEKWALGLPRPTEILQKLEPPFAKVKDRFKRYSSPLHFHVFRDAQGYAVRIAAFASPRLPDLETSARYLSRCVTSMEQWLLERAGKAAPPPRPRPAPVRSVRPMPPARGPKAGDRVTGILQEKNRKGAWKVRVEGFDVLGAIPNWAQLPASLKAGDSVPLKIRSTNPKNPSFDWVKE